MWPSYCGHILFTITSSKIRRYGSLITINPSGGKTSKKNDEKEWQLNIENALYAKNDMATCEKKVILNHMSFVGSITLVFCYHDILTT